MGNGAHLFGPRETRVRLSGKHIPLLDPKRPCRRPCERISKPCWKSFSVVIVEKKKNKKKKEEKQEEVKWDKKMGELLRWSWNCMESCVILAHCLYI